MPEITFCASGHCNCGKKGEDLVCAGASALVIAISEYVKDNSYKLKSPPKSIINDGYAQISFIPKLRYYKEIKGVLDVLLCGFSWLHNEYPKNVRIKNFD